MTGAKKLLTLFFTGIFLISAKAAVHGGEAQTRPLSAEVLADNITDGSLSITFDRDSLCQLYDRLYTFDRLPKITGSVSSAHGLKELKYSIFCGNFLIDEGYAQFDDGGNWCISPVTLMTDDGYHDLSNIVTIEAEDLQGSRAQSSITIYSTYFDQELFDSLDFKDNDGDGLLNYMENIYGTDPNGADTDKDELNDYYEINFTYTDPLAADSDSNGILDGDEDFDMDLLTNKEEEALSSDPHSKDTDDDGLWDKDEAEAGTDIWMKDTDSDGIFDGKEAEAGTDTLSPNTDSPSMTEKFVGIRQGICLCKIYGAGIKQSKP